MESVPRWINSIARPPNRSSVNDDRVHRFSRRRAEIDSTLWMAGNSCGLQPGIAPSCSDSGSITSFILHLASSASKWDFSEKSRSFLYACLLIILTVFLLEGTFDSGRYTDFWLQLDYIVEKTTRNFLTITVKFLYSSFPVGTWNTLLRLSISQDKIFFQSAKWPDKVSGNPRICPVNIQFWLDIVCRPAGHYFFPCIRCIK